MDRTVQITVVGTSDLHGRLSTLPLLGGYLRILRDRAPDSVVLVDAGDMFQGTLESNMNEGAAVIDAYRELGYDAAAIGNHEFDYGPVGEPATVPRGVKEGPGADARGAIKARAQQATGAFPLLSANLLEDDKPLSWPNVRPSVIVTKHGVKVGVIGVTTIDTPKTTIAANVQGIRVTPLAEAISAQAKALRDQGATVVIVAAHAGGECKKTDSPADLSSCEAGAEIFKVARELPAGAVQVIVAGHTHQRIAHEVAGTAIIESGSYGKAFGRVDLTVDAATGKVQKTTIHPPEELTQGAVFEGVKVEPAKDLERIIAPSIEGARARRAEGLGASLGAPFKANYREENELGNLIAGLLLEQDPGSDIALMNGGGLRTDLPAGPLTYGALYDVLPFENKVAHLKMTGRQLRETFEQNLSGKGGILSVAGARVEGHCEAGKLAVKIVLTSRRKAERQLKDEDRVTVITNEFLATRGDGFGPSESVEIDEDGPPFRERVAAALKERGGELLPADWFMPEKRHILLPAPMGPDICEGR